MRFSAGATFVLGVLAAPLAARFGSKRVLIGGSVVTVAPFLLLAAGHDHAWQIYTASALVGAGLGLAFSAMSAIAVEAVPPTQTAAAGGMNANIRTLGGAIGSAVAASILSSGITATHPVDRGGVIVPRLLADRGRADFTIGTGRAIRVVALPCGMVLRRRRGPRPRRWRRRGGCRGPSW
ncbi:MFS transporter [Kitasatospora brasiliensis]|uniref:MFS transporter n=1 Tax=Kitasatospora brasiliensis TaxID=3058040 RepID=UPI0029305B83|nr:MFS transporter [Kitasatospora sp. K002]